MSTRGFVSIGTPDRFRAPLQSFRFLSAPPDRRRVHALDREIQQAQHPPRTSDAADDPSGICL